MGHILPCLKRAMIAGIFIGALSFDARSDEGGAVLSSDIAIQFTCENAPTAIIESGFDEFLGELNFRVLDLGSLQRQMGAARAPTYIAALDSANRIIQVYGFPFPPQSYALNLVTRPPTERSSDVERRLLEFISQRLSCETTKVSHAENQADRVPYFNEEVQRIERLFRESENLRGGKRI